MKNEQLIKTFLKLLSSFFTFFLLVAFVTTCCMTLFLSAFSQTLNFSFTSENISLAAKLTFANVMLLSLIFTVIDFIRRKITVELPAKRITDAAEKLMKGDFSARVDKKIAEDENFSRIGCCFNKMAEELGGVEALRSDFIANVSHELKTPLSVMQNYGTMLQSPALSDEKRIEYAKGITENSRRLASLITNILKLNRLENQQIFPAYNRFNLSEQLCECMLQFEDIWDKKEIELKTDIPDCIFINSDAELLTIVWNNLLSNAFKFTDKNGRVGIALSCDEKFATVKISDTGCGISSDTGLHIFEKFYQGDTSHTAEGNGLGLALVKRVVDIMQGEISVESELGMGTAFTVKLPI